MQVMAYDPYLNQGYCEEHGISPVSLEFLLKNADAVSLHLPLNEETLHMIDGKALGMMKKDVLIVNASRGGIIDEEAAFQALKAGEIGGLGLDAFEQEPPEGSPLLGLDNVVVTPHTGAHTKEAIENMAALSVDNLIKALRGEPCEHIVTA